MIRTAANASQNGRQQRGERQRRDEIFAMLSYVTAVERNLRIITGKEQERRGKIVRPFTGLVEQYGKEAVLDVLYQRMRDLLGNAPFTNSETCRLLAVTATIAAALEGKDAEELLREIGSEVGEEKEAEAAILTGRVRGLFGEAVGREDDERVARIATFLEAADEEERAWMVETLVAGEALKETLKSEVAEDLFSSHLLSLLDRWEEVDGKPAREYVLVWALRNTLLLLSPEQAFYLANGDDGEVRALLYLVLKRAYADGLKEDEAAQTYSTLSILALSTLIVLDFLITLPNDPITRSPLRKGWHRGVLGGEAETTLKCAESWASDVKFLACELPMHELQRKPVLRIAANLALLALEDVARELILRKGTDVAEYIAFLQGLIPYLVPMEYGDDEDGSGNSSALLRSITYATERSAHVLHRTFQAIAQVASTNLKSDEDEGTEAKRKTVKADNSDLETDLAALALSMPSAFRTVAINTLKVVLSDFIALSLLIGEETTRRIARQLVLFLRMDEEREVQTHGTTQHLPLLCNYPYEHYRHRYGVALDPRSFLYVFGDNEENEGREEGADMLQARYFLHFLVPEGRSNGAGNVAEEDTEATQHLVRRTEDEARKKIVSLVVDTLRRAADDTQTHDEDGNGSFTDSTATDNAVAILSALAFIAEADWSSWGEHIHARIGDIWQGLVAATGKALDEAMKDAGVIGYTRTNTFIIRAGMQAMITLGGYCKDEDEVAEFVQRLHQTVDEWVERYISSLTPPERNGWIVRELLDFIVEIGYRRAGRESKQEDYPVLLLHNPLMNLDGGLADLDIGGCDARTIITTLSFAYFASALSASNAAPPAIALMPAERIRTDALYALWLLVRNPAKKLAADFLLEEVDKVSEAATRKRIEAHDGIAMAASSSIGDLLLVLFASVPRNREGTAMNKNIADAIIERYTKDKCEAGAKCGDVLIHRTLHQYLRRIAEEEALGRAWMPKDVDEQHARLVFNYAHLGVLIVAREMERRGIVTLDELLQEAGIALHNGEDETVLFSPSASFLESLVLRDSSSLALEMLLDAWAKEDDRGYNTGKFKAARVALLIRIVPRIIEQNARERLARRLAIYAGEDKTGKGIRAVLEFTASESTALPKEIRYSVIRELPTALHVFAESGATNEAIAELYSEITATLARFFTEKVRGGCRLIEEDLRRQMGMDVYDVTGEIGEACYNLPTDIPALAQVILTAWERLRRVGENAKLPAATTTMATKKMTEVKALLNIWEHAGGDNELHRAYMNLCMRSA